jgi:hypothetical protein
MTEARQAAKNKTRGKIGAATNAINLNVFNFAIPSTYRPPSALLRVNRNSEINISSNESNAKFATLPGDGGTTSSKLELGS